LVNFLKQSSVKSKHPRVSLILLSKPAEIKIKSGGGHGGHNGLNDIFKKIGTKDFFRVRIGIGHPGKENDVTGWVLGKPNQEDKNLIEKSYERLESVFDLLCNKEFSEAQLKLHTK